MKKTKKCKICGKEFQPRLSTSKYCSKDCLFESMRKPKKCTNCGKEFFPKGARKTCSIECCKAQEGKMKGKRVVEYKKRKCKICGNEYELPPGRKNNGYCSVQCFYKHSKETRKWENNPNFRGGYFTKENYTGSTQWKHSNACKKKKERQKEKHGYNFCEVCKKNENHSPVETHHIYFASRVPKHKNLHHDKNLIVVCRPCHLKFHNGKEYQEIFIKLEEERGLKKLFEKK